MAKLLQFVSFFLFKKKSKKKNCYFCSFLSCIWWLPATKTKKKKISKHIHTSRATLLCHKQWQFELQKYKKKQSNKTSTTRTHHLISCTSSSGFIAFVLPSFHFFFIDFVFVLLRVYVQLSRLQVPRLFTSNPNGSPVSDETKARGSWNFPELTLLTLLMGSTLHSSSSSRRSKCLA